MIAATRQPCAFAYGRVSDDKQIKTGNSLPEQIARMDAYYKSRLVEQQIGWGGLEYDEFGVSASKKGFCQRPAGKRIMGQLQPGDHLIVDHLDRIWRDPMDFENLLHWFKTHQITLHIVQMDIVAGSLDTAGPMGELTLRIMVAVARAESQRNSERHIHHYAAARKQGMSISRIAPTGTKKVWRKSAGKNRKYLEWDPKARGIMATIVQMHDEQHLQFNEIGWRLEERLAELYHRKFRRSAFYKRYWTDGRVKQHYVCEIYYRDHHIMDVREIPPNVARVAERYWRQRRDKKRDGVTDAPTTVTPSRPS